MLQQTRVETAAPYYERFIEHFPDRATLAAADDDEVLAAWSGLGYYRRARQLLSAARRLEEAGPGWPQTAAEWLQLPGVGPYTAAAVASIAFGEVDTGPRRQRRAGDQPAGGRARRPRPNGGSPAPGGAGARASRSTPARRRQPGADGARRHRLPTATAPLPALPADRRVSGRGGGRGRELPAPPAGSGAALRETSDGAGYQPGPPAHVPPVGGGAAAGRALGAAMGGGRARRNRRARAVPTLWRPLAT